MAAHEQPVAAVDRGLARDASEIGTDGGDASVRADPQIGAPLAVDVEHRPAGQEHRPSSSRVHCV